MGIVCMAFLLHTAQLLHERKREGGREEREGERMRGDVR